MKKTLIAMAALAATGVAFAQSSVTLYGVADASLAKSTGKSAAVSANGTMNNGSSRLGVRGTEDLGGGLKASFNFEQAVSLGNGATDANTFQRAAWMNLSGGFGNLRLGRTLNPTFFARAAWELTGTANYSNVASQFGYLGGSRNNAQVAYTTPSMGGVTATLGYVFKGNNIVGAKPATDTTPAVPGVERAKVDLNVIYKNGPLAASLGYNKVQDAEKNVEFGASYDFGGFKVAGGIIDPAGASKGFSLGVSMAAGPVNLVLDIARDTEAKDTNMLVEVKYPLSKRTFVYTAFLRDGKGKNAEDVNNFALGLRHNF